MDAPRLVLAATESSARQPAGGAGARRGWRQRHGAAMGLVHVVDAGAWSGLRDLLALKRDLHGRDGRAGPDPS